MTSSGARPVRAPRGSELSCRGWQQEAALRMLMNNLDPEVAERPDDLVVYGGTGQAARSWEAFDAIVRALRAPRPTTRRCWCSRGKPVGVFRTHERAPRVLIANSQPRRQLGDLGALPASSSAPGLMMYGQMTAGSWIYIGTQGILQGTYETFAELARQHFGGTLRGTRRAHRRPRRHGRRPAAGRDHERRRVPRASRSTRRASQRRLETRYLDRCTDDLDEALRWAREAAAAGAAAVDRPGRQRRRGRARAGAPRRAVRRRHRPDLGPRPAQRLRPGRALARGGGRAARAPTPTPTSRRAMASMADHVRAMLAFQAARRRRLRLRQQPPRPGPGRRASRTPSTSRASCPPTSGRSSARARGRSAGSRSPATRPTSAPPTRPSSSSSPTTRRCAAGSRMAQEQVAVPGPAGAHLLARLRRARTGRPGLQRAGRAAARSRRRSSSAATTSTPARSPRPTARPRPCTTAPTRSPTGRSSTPCSTRPRAPRWVCFHHGGGVGIGYSQHAGMVIVADGTDLAAQSSSACSPPTRAWASCATPTPATSAPSRSPASAASRIPMLDD